MPAITWITEPNTLRKAKSTPMKIVANWFRRYFSDPQIIFLAILLLILFAVIITMGSMLMPVLASIVIAYLLEGLVVQLERRGLPRTASVLVVYVAFLVFVALVLVGVVPSVSRQITDLVQQLPSMISVATTALMDLPEHHPELVTEAQVAELIGAIRAETLLFGQRVLSWSLASVVGIITILVYLILMPLLVFFFMKDKDLILGWFRQFLPTHRTIVNEIWRDVDRQISNYVRGKAWEILIVWLVSYATFSGFGLEYAMLLSLLVGFSVIIPYIGAAVVTVPVLLVAWFQWGWTPTFIWLAVAYFIIQALDGNVLVPLLFSEVVNLHPVAIIVAILVFGGIWGFWGVFFAIPLATLVQAILTAWPIPPDDPVEASA
ncbi:putative permease perM [Thiocapsa sp. KS1]|nr:putative permease perM [Thiocapsa sp. KS1]